LPSWFFYLFCDYYGDNWHAQLTRIDPTKRLGSGQGDVEEVKQHPFFAGIDWNDIYHKKHTPPLKAALIRHYCQKSIFGTSILVSRLAPLAKNQIESIEFVSPEVSVQKDLGSTSGLHSLE